MNWFRFLGICLCTASLIIIIAARHKTQPIFFGQILKEIAFLFVFDLLITNWAPISFGLSLYTISRLNNNLVWNLKDEQIRKKFIKGIGLLCLNFSFIHAQESLYDPGKFGTGLLYYYVPIVIMLWIFVRILFIIYRFFFWISKTKMNETQWTEKISQWRIGFTIYCISALLGVVIVILFGYISLFSNQSAIGIIAFIIIQIMTFIYSFGFYRQIPRYCPPAPTLNQKKTRTSQLENTFKPQSDGSDSGNFKSDEMTDISSEAKYRFQGFIGGEIKPMDKPSTINYPMPISCPICKNVLTFDGKCQVCKKRICPRCFNAESLNSIDCRNCAYIFENRKKSD